MIRTPIAVNTASNPAVNLVSPSRIKNFRPSARPSMFISRLRACWVYPRAGGVGGDARQVHASGAVLDEEQDIQAP